MGGSEDKEIRADRRVYVQPVFTGIEYKYRVGKKTKEELKCR